MDGLIRFLPLVIGPPLQLGTEEYLFNKLHHCFHSCNCPFYSRRNIIHGTQVEEYRQRKNIRLNRCGFVYDQCLNSIHQGTSVKNKEIWQYKIYCVCQNNNIYSRFTISWTPYTKLHFRWKIHGNLEYCCIGYVCARYNKERKKMDLQSVHKWNEHFLLSM